MSILSGPTGGFGGWKDGPKRDYDDKHGRKDDHDWKWKDDKHDGKDGGKQLGRGRASDLGRGRRSGRRPDDQIGLGHIQPGIKQAGDHTDQPRIACRSATTEDQRSLTRGAHPPCGVDLRLILVGPRPVGGRRRNGVQR